MSISDKSRIVLNMMIEKGIIPAQGQFEVTKDHIDYAFSTWNILHHPNYTERLKPTVIRYGRKIAGINLMKLNLERDGEPTLSNTRSKSDLKCGIVYIITNSAFPGYYKVGITTNLEARLGAYQTCDPLRRYKVEHYNFVEDRFAVEKDLLAKYKLNAAAGEWVDDENIKNEIISL